MKLTPFIRWQLEEAAWSIDAAIRLTKFYDSNHTSVKACIKRAAYFLKAATQSIKKIKQ